MGRRVEVILVWRRRRGGGKSGQLLLPFLVVNVSQAVVEMGVGVICTYGIKKDGFLFCRVIIIR